MKCANHPDRERVAFCQNCGKPLCVECSRTIGQAVFCEPCLAARLAGAGPIPAAAATGAPVPPSSFPGAIPPPSAPGEPNPGLAALLGFIPGVGAFYNGQYAKGVVHLLVFAVLISLAGEHGIFGLFIAGWVFYQVIEAHQTARARRDGSPLPNPFGLNDIGERLGFGKSWPSTSGPVAGGYVPPVSAPGTQGTTVPPATAGGTPVPPPGGWGAPVESYAPPNPPYAAQQSYDPSWAGYAAGQPFAESSPSNFYTAPLPTDYMPPPSTGRSLPTGAFVLIGLGTFFLLMNTGRFSGFAVHWLIPFLLIGFGVWVFVRRMTSTGLSFSDDGSPLYRLRLYSAARNALWPILVGVLLLLDMTRILPWSHSWPLLIVLAGVIALLRRAAYAGVPPAAFVGMPPAAPMGTPAAASPGMVTSIVPVETPSTDEASRDRS